VRVVPLPDHDDRALEDIELLKQYETVLAALHAGVVIHGPDSAILEANQRARSLLGLQDLEGRLATDPQWVFLEADHSPMALERFPVVQVITSGEPVRGLIAIIQPPVGNEVWLEVNALPVLDDAEGPRRVVVTFIDVTDRILAEQALKESEMHYRLLPENASDIVILVRGDGLLQWVSPSAEEILGRTPQELVGSHPWDIVHPEDQANAIAALAEVATGEVEYSRFDLRVKKGDGKHLWMSAGGHHAADDQVVISFRDADAQVLAEQAEQAATARYRPLAENASDVVYAHDLEGRVTWVSPSVTSTLGWTQEEFTARTLISLVHPDDVVAESSHKAAVVESTLDTARAAVRFATRDGDWRWMSVRAQVLRDENGMATGAIEALRDIHEEIRGRERLAASQELFASVMTSSDIGMVITDLDGHILVVNPALCRMIQRDETWMREHRVDDVHPDDQALFARSRAGLVEDGSIASTELRLVRAEGEVVWIRQVGLNIIGVEGQADRIMAQVEDVTAEHQAREALKYQAFHDPLTGLRNRAWVTDILVVDLRTAQRTGVPVAVMFIDLDNFKLVNDSLGHSAGDEVLATVAARIDSVLRPEDHVGRFGGDEFIVIVPDAGQVAMVERVAERISTAISGEIEIRGHRIVPTASIGIAVSTLTSTAAGLLRDTDAALFRAKAEGRSRWHFYDEGMHEEAVARLTVESELRAAVANDEFVVHYQPIVTLVDGRTVGYEALVRWQHGSRGLLTPAAFLPVAEETGLIVGIGDHVLDQVCTLLAARPDLPGPVSVNVSAVQFARADWLDSFTATLARHGVDPSRLVVEVTETAVLSLLAGTRADLAAVRARGVGVHVDDFGTGFSSIALLRDLPVTGLKLDARFVADLSEDEGEFNALSSGLAGLVNGLGLTGIAEGIETDAQARILSSQGWTHGQGYYFGRPGPIPS
jgi:diguanylate cyclase (GGDEF)-like protein/PAS domain S-box-containing protein